MSDLDPLAEPEDNEHYCKWHTDEDDCDICGECIECGMCDCHEDEQDFDEESAR